MKKVKNYIIKSLPSKWKIGVGAVVITGILAFLNHVIVTVFDAVIDFETQKAWGLLPKGFLTIKLITLEIHIWHLIILFILLLIIILYSLYRKNHKVEARTDKLELPDIDSNKEIDRPYVNFNVIRAIRDVKEGRLTAEELKITIENSMNSNMMDVNLGCSILSEYNYCPLYLHDKTWRFVKKEDQNENGSEVKNI